MNKYQKSDSLFIYSLLALSGGGMDAYSYLCRDKVFANAQTGNILLFGVSLAEGNLKNAVRYFIPVFAFAIGIILSDVIRKMITGTHIHWRQLSVMVEILILVFVAFIPLKLNIVANSLLSMACGFQVESFRTVRGNSITTTMCIGNLRSGTNNLDKFLMTKEKVYLSKALIYYGIILFFVLGAVCVSYMIKFAGTKAIFLSVLLLFISFFMMLDKRAKSDEQE